MQGLPSRESRTDKSGVQSPLSMASHWPWELTGGSLQMYVLDGKPAVPFVLEPQEA